MSSAPQTTVPDSVEWDEWEEPLCWTHFALFIFENFPIFWPTIFLGILIDFFKDFFLLGILDVLFMWTALGITTAVLPHVRPVLVSRIPLRVCTSHVTACILVGHKEYEQ